VEDAAETGPFGNGDRFGASLVAGDFNGDGYDDLAIGVPEENGDTAGGAVNVLFGSSSGLRSNAAGDGTGRADQFWHQNSPGVEGPADISDRFGMSLAAGDFNDDGKDDLAIGAAEEFSSSQSPPGEVNVLYGSSGGLQTASPPDQLWTQNSPGVEDTTENGDNFGSFVKEGDFNGDGYGDLAAAAETEGIGAKPSAGAVNILYGSATGLQTTSPVDQFWNQDTPGVEENAVGYDLFGYSLG
jgi:hypothetical protein